MVNFYIYYNTHTHTHTHIYIFINIKNNGKPETVHRYWPIPKYIVPLVKPVYPPIQDWLPYYKHSRTLQLIDDTSLNIRPSFPSLLYFEKINI